VLSIDQIRKYPLFAGLSEAELAALAPCIIKRTFGRGAYLFHPGNPGLSMYLIESGWVRLFFADVRGQEYLLNMFGPRACVGLPLLPDDQVRLAGAAAQQETVALVLGRDDVFDFMQRFPQFMQNIYLEMTSSLRKLTLYAQAHAILKLDGRLASLLLYQAMNGPSTGTNEIELALNQAEIASWVSVSRGRINQALSKMQERNLIRLEGQKIILLDLQGLAKMAEGLLTYWV
jgi:CRP/FNR family cyclic AMP-dependent transcriptional regulator